MGNKTGAQLITAVRTRSARTNDSVLITEDFVLDALNEAQIQISNRVTRILDLDKTSRDLAFKTWSTTPVVVDSGSRATTGITTIGYLAQPFVVGDIVTIADSDSDVTDFGGTYEVTTSSLDEFTYWDKNFTAASSPASFGTAVKTADSYIKDISSLNAAHIIGIWVLNGDSTLQRGLKYRPYKKFRKLYIPISEQSPAEPREYTRQGDNILFNCPIDRDSQGLRLHIDYTPRPTDLANGGVASELPNSNKGLILFALAEVYGELAMTMTRFQQIAVKTRVLFEDWLEKYSDYQEMLIEELVNVDDYTRGANAY